MKSAGRASKARLHVVNIAARLLALSHVFHELFDQAGNRDWREFSLALLLLQVFRVMPRCFDDEGLPAKDLVSVCVFSDSSRQRNVYDLKDINRIADSGCLLRGEPADVSDPAVSSSIFLFAKARAP